VFKQQPITAVEREQLSEHAAPKQPPIARDWACAIGRLLHSRTIVAQVSDPPVVQCTIGRSHKLLKCAQHWQSRQPIHWRLLATGERFKTVLVRSRPTHQVTRSKPTYYKNCLETSSLIMS